MKEVTATGKTIDSAIETALSQLGVSRDDVEIEIIENPAKGVLGIFGQKDAKILVKVKESPEITMAEFVETILTKMGIEAKVAAAIDGSRITLDVSGPDMGIVIGRRGETLDALQQIAQLYVNRIYEEYYKIRIDTENYRAKREEALIILAKGLAKKVLKTRKEVALEPMKAYERRIIHTTLQDYNRISTHSIGEEPNRRLVVSYRYSNAPKGNKKEEK
ncbi:RNA-binding cell elongation regulator Jag/EloR [Acetivibrio sp. MSJd-27]|jgi:single-stranded nucleic acid binding R3H domain protein|uniref:RNA-binding cell elongation regulator Jag/EloR n=1 Tax=Acetivibrio sp. MSJd-27 TaxID=2841523 RepID=UPI0015AC21EE|nr:RNA-binding cell elongation regulator Jag/EloR [Acetivibrio sp. MSJd-27]MBU5449550.1 protein jag [Acetivibrio sp. MSJd-27]